MTSRKTAPRWSPFRGRHLSIVVVLTSIGLRPAAAQTITSGVAIPRAAREVIDGTLSPFCPGVILASCPSDQADSLRRAIVARALAGESRERIQAGLYAAYGDRVRAVPRARGFGLVAWAAPPIVVLIGIAWVTRWMRRARRTSAVAAPAPISHPTVVTSSAESDDAEYQRRIEASIRHDGE